MTNQHGGRRDNKKRRPDDKRGGTRVAGEGKKLGRPKKVVVDSGLTHYQLDIALDALMRIATHAAPLEDQTIAQIVRAAQVKIQGER